MQQQRRTENAKEKRVVQDEVEEGDEEEIITSQPQAVDELSRRRQVRKELLAMVQQTQEQKKDIIQTASMKKSLDSLNQLFPEVTHAREGSLDALVLKTLGEYQVESVSKLHVGQQFDSSQFIEKIRVNYSDQTQEINWNKLGGEVAKHFRKTPQVTFMYGPLKVESKEPKKREKRKRFTQGEAINPDEVSEITKEKNETTRKVKEMHKKIKLEEQKNEEIPFLNVAVDPNSFTKTIENIFHLGFLVKDGMLTLKSDDDKMVCSLTDDEVVVDKKGNKQCILKLDLSTWKKLSNK